MRKTVALAIVLFFGTIGWAGNGVALTIIDDYIGADPNSTMWNGKDVVGDPAYFDISKMEVNLLGDQFVMEIYGNYFENIGQSNTQLGDLFVSTDGWTPLLPTELDNFHNGGEDWEFVVALDNHLGTSGVASLHALDPTDPTGYRNAIKLSEDVKDPSWSALREGQEVWYGGPADSWLTQGEWSVTGDMLRISIDTMGLGWDFSDLDMLGYHYTMTCGNDVIEGGGVPAPEPASMLLLGSGLLGLAVIGRGLGRKKGMSH